MSAETTQVISLLGNVLILSILLESAYTIIFSWRIFIKYFSGKGFRVPLMVVSNYILLNTFNYDFFTKIFSIIAPAQPDQIASTFTVIGGVFSALLLSGGSKAILEILNKLKLRNIEEMEHREYLIGLESQDYKAPDLVFDRASSTLKGLGGTWQAGSGTTGGYSTISPGLYNCPAKSLMVGTEDSPPVAKDTKYAAAPYLDQNGFGWFFWLGKQNLGIHPDGNVPGTEGCIGIKDEDTRALFEKLKAKYNQKVTVQVV